MGRTRLVFLLAVLAQCACDDDSAPLENTPPPPAPRMFNVAGTGVAGLGSIDQLPLDTDLHWPQDITFTPDSLLVVVDWGNHRVIGIDPSTDRFRLMVGTFDGVAGEPCAPHPSPCDVGGTDTPLNHPTDVRFDADGMMILCAWHNAAVFLADIASDAMSRIAGTGRACYDGDDKAAFGSCVSFPSASVRDSRGRLVFTDQTNQVVRVIDESGDIHTLAGTPPVWDGTRYVPQTGFSGDGGPATLARFRFGVPTTGGKLAIDATDHLYVADTQNHAVRVIDASGTIHRFAGAYPATAGFGGDGGPATSAKLNEPRDVACDADGNVFIADAGNHVIRRVNAAGVITTVAGVAGVTGDGSDDGRSATQTGLNYPFGIAVDPRGNLWIADTDNHRIRMVER
jgi:sugar lactone lactonase YvrE